GADMAALARTERGRTVLRRAGAGSAHAPQDAGLGDGLLWPARPAVLHALADVRLVWPAPGHRLLRDADRRRLRAVLPVSLPGHRLHGGAGLVPVRRKVSAGDAGRVLLDHPDVAGGHD